MTKSRLFLTACFLVLSGLSQADGSDWYNWRGPFQNGFSPDTNLPASFSPDPKAKDNNLIWKAPYGCRSTPLVMGDRLYMINYTGAHQKDGAGKPLPELDPRTIQERVMCLDANTGEFKWQHTFNVFHTDIVTSRLGWTMLAGDPVTGNVYAHGTQGLFFCFDRDGKVLWSKSLTEEYGRISGYGGRVTSPIVAEDLVIIGMLNSSWGDYAKGANRFLAMNKLTGEVVWWSDPAGQVKGTYYSVPVVANINGQALLISGAADGAVYGLKLRTGEKVWGYQFGATAINTSPVVDGNYVYIGHGEENPDNAEKGRIICVDASKVENGKPALVWKKDKIKVRFSSPIVHEGRLYIADETGKLYCFDAKKGSIHWKYHYSKGSQGSPVLADGKIYIGEVDSHFYILEAGDKKCTELHDQFFPGKGENIEINGSAAVAGGKVYFATTEETYCIGRKDAKAAANPPVYSGPSKSSGKIKALQIVPADVAVYPGSVVEYKVKGFDENGNFVRDVKTGECTWFLPNPVPPPTAKTPPPPLDGVVEAGKLTVGKTKPSQQGYVTAILGDVTARGRVRVMPLLPYSQDFSKVPDGAVPGGWVNTQGKFLVKTLKDGNKVLAKVNTSNNPLIARANAFIGPPTMKDYTIECDVLGTTVQSETKVDEWPDVGVVANRYTLVLAGKIQKLRIVSWDVLPRIDETINYPWKAGTWYRLKLTVAVEGDKAIVRGKAWPRDEKEPQAWTLTATDPRPNTEGSPALYGFVLGALENRPGTDILYDNLKITPNKK